MLALVADGGASQWAIYKFTSFFQTFGQLISELLYF